MGDIRHFLNDSKILKDLALEDPLKYGELMLGINADDDQLLAKELKDTRIWDYGITVDLLNDNRLIIRINSLIHFISFNNFWVHALVFAMLSFIGILLIYRAFVDLILHKRLFFFALLLTPTFAFWGSGITKESLLVLAFGIFAFGLKKALEKPRFIYLP